MCNMLVTRRKKKKDKEMEYVRGNHTILVGWVLKTDAALERLVEASSSGDPSFFSRFPTSKRVLPKGLV